MANDGTSITSTNSLIQSLQQETANTGAKKSDGSIGKNEFLQMLVTQLKNQDPLNPMNGDEFAVNLAQFSQLEQLVSINGKLGSTDSTGDSSSLASYLGHEVLLDKKTLDFEGGNAGLIRTNIPADASDVQVDLLDAGGNVINSLSLGEYAKGDQSISLDGLDVPNGSYEFRLSMVTASGGQAKLLGRVGGVVDGFIPGADPKLLIAGREVAPADVKAVLAPARL